MHDEDYMVNSEKAQNITNGNSSGIIKMTWQNQQEKSSANEIKCEMCECMMRKSDGNGWIFGRVGLMYIIKATRQTQLKIKAQITTVGSLACVTKTTWQTEQFSFVQRLKVFI